MPLILNYCFKAAEINSAKRCIKTQTKLNNKLNYDWSILPYYRLHLFDPDNPFYYDFGPRLRARILPKPGLMISASLEKSVVSSFDRFGEVLKEVCHMLEQI